MLKGHEQWKNNKTIENAIYIDRGRNKKSIFLILSESEIRISISI
jgi:hypothetical protein